jgi:hypothetical protein
MKAEKQQNTPKEIIETDDKPPEADLNNQLGNIASMLTENVEATPEEHSLCIHSSRRSLELVDCVSWPLC